MTRILALLALMAFASPVAAQAPAQGSLTLTFETGADTGAVMVALYDDEESYRNGKPIRAVMVDVAGGERSTTISNLPAGTYGMKAFHDVNGNGRMDVNPFGMPTEPFAFSNNAAGNMGPAGWDRASFTLSGDVAQTIRIR